ncbi:MAG: CvpA family protein [Betaproteobacteria bacterium]|jgi:membrane protein required for colicin V production|nr:CvpA family protein [Burkholderiales bacterium]NBX13785.1 CvpA family protein [Betaproteobacteria bacterium]NBX90711.1 CvpA family protein [Betaproteobacteria bacterium]
MFTTDWFLLGILLISLLLGAWRGLVYEVISVLGWIAAFVLAQWFAPEVAERLPMQGSSQAFRYAAAFVLIFVLSVFASGLLSALVRKVISAVGLRPVDRILGAVFGLFRGLILLLALTVVIHMTSMSQSDWWQESRGRPLLSTLIKGLKPMLPVKFGAFLPDGLD